ncbi:MmcQ/YjbR family DNA-binding protein [Roseateles saccharophilus]|nr:MmcQ/YjbR family DNA-binding protein [Roseateles saccharophilus]
MRRHPPTQATTSFSALARFAMELPGAAQDIKWGADGVASVGGKMFFVGGPHPGAWTHCSFKVDDHRFLELTGLPGLKPAPYAARYHWVAVDDAKALPLSELKALVVRSHALVAGKLSRKVRLGLGIVV